MSSDLMVGGEGVCWSAWIYFDGIDAACNPNSRNVAS